MGNHHDVDLPALPDSQPDKLNNYIHRDQLSRKKLQGLLHLITGELKARGTKTPHIFLPFRSRVDDRKLTLFLSRIFPKGIMINTSQEIAVKTLLREFDEFTLICGLKYLWCRLPNDEIIGWNVYLEFKRKEQEAGYPKDAFLTIMPKCLSSSSHASIVYDFLDLLISIASNSQYNHLNGRKISKMASLWAFRSTPGSRSAFYDATLVKEVSFLEGLSSWKQTCNGLFHLLLAFLRAMLPDTGAEALNLPKTLQSLLITNSYPPPENASSIKSVITIPCVHIRSTRRSANPFELISKVRQNLSFEKKDTFLSIENYTILRNIFQKSTTDEIVSTLTEESRRVLTRLTAEPESSEFSVYPGWSQDQSREPEDPNIPQYSEVTISNVTLQDFFIWTWLSSLGSDQSSTIKSAFGRSIVVEAGLRGFQKWMVLTETSIPSEEYIGIFKGAGIHNEAKKSESPRIPASRINAELPPPPPAPKPKSLEPIQTSSHSKSSTAQLGLPKSPVKLSQPHSPKMLPKVDFGDDDFSLESPHSFVTSPVFESRGYTEPIPYEQESTLAHNFQEQASVKPSKNNRRPRPPPLESKTDARQQERSTKPPRRERSPEKLSSQQQFDIPEFQQYQNYSSQHSEPSESGYSEPFDNYRTPFESTNKPVSSEPFDNYNIPGEVLSNQAKKHLTPDDVHKKYYQITPNPPAKSAAPIPPPMHTESNTQSPNNHGGYNRDDRRAGPDTNVKQPRHTDPQHGYQNRPEIDSHNGHERSRDPAYSQHLYDDAYETTGYRDDRMHGKNEDYRGDEGQVDRGHESRSHPDSEEKARAKAKEEKKRKKKKRSSKQKELQKMMEQFPDAPPPSLPPSLLNNNSSVGGSATSYDSGQDGHRGHGSLEDPGSYNQTEHATNVHASLERSRDFSPSQHHPKPYTNQDGHYAGNDRPSIASGLPHSEQPPKESSHYQHEHVVHINVHPNLSVPQQGSSPVNHHYTKTPSPFPSSTGTPSPASKSPLKLSPATHGQRQTRVNDRLSPTVAHHGQPAPYNHSVSPQGVHGYHAHSPGHQQPHEHAPPQNAHYKHSEPHPMHQQIPSPSQNAAPMAHGAPVAHAPMSPAAGAPMAQPMMYQGQPQYYTGPQGGYQSPVQYQMPPQPYYPPPPQAYAYSPQSGYAPPQGGYAPPQGGYAPPQGGYAPPQGGYAPPQGGYAPPQGYFPPQPSRPAHAPKAKPTTSELTMMHMPAVNTFNKNTKNKAGLRAALKQGEFGI